MILWWDQRISIALGMSGAAGAAGRGAGSERGAAGPWGRGWPARRGGKGKRSLPSVESPVHPVVFARAVSSTGYPLSTPHGITSVIKGEPNWSGSSTNRVCVACSCVEVSIGAKHQPSRTRAMSHRGTIEFVPAGGRRPFRS